MVVSGCGSATLQAKKEYRQKSEQKPAGRKKPPPSRPTPVAPAPQPASYQAPQETIEEVEEGYVITPWVSLIDCGTGTRCAEQDEQQGLDV